MLARDTDCYSYLHLNNPNTRYKVYILMPGFNMLYCWRENDIEKRKFTWFRYNQMKKTRLDFFLNLYFSLYTLIWIKVESYHLIEVNILEFLC